MKCEQAVEIAYDSLLDLAEPAVRREFEAHLRGCEPCRQAFEKARKSLAVLDEWQPAVPPAKLWRRKTTVRRVARRASWKPAVAAAAALIAVAALAVWLGRQPVPANGDLRAAAPEPLPAPPVEPRPVLEERKSSEPPPEAPRSTEQKTASAPSPSLPEVKPAEPASTPLEVRPAEDPRKEVPKDAAKPAPEAPRKTAVAARVERLKGDVFVATSAREPQRALEGQELLPGERLLTGGKGSSASIRHSDSIRLELGFLSEVRFAGPGEVLLFQGKVEVEAAKREKELTVATLNATVRVLEARFTLESKDDTTLLAVQQGAVQFTNLVTEKVQQVKAGQNAKAQGHPKVDQRKVDAAVAKGVAYLRKAWAGHEGAVELVLYTLLHAGVPENDPEVQALLKRILAQEPQRTYNTALRAMILEKVDRVRHQEEIWKCAQFLVDNMAATGQWGYGTPTQYGPVPKGVPTPRADTATSGGKGKVVDFSQPEKPRVRQRIPVTKKRDGVATDNSNSQYASLGLRACHDAGIDLPKDVIERAKKWMVDTQVKEEGQPLGGDAVASGGPRNAPPKGWGYYGVEAPYGSMTAGAVGAVTIYDYILDGEKRLSWKSDPVVLSGLAWMAKNFSVKENPLIGKVRTGLAPTAAWFYYLYALERVGMLFGTEYIGSHEWYPEGAKVILELQNADGSWYTDVREGTNAVWDTCFAILFLRRATRPLQDVASEDPSRSRR